MQEPRGLPVRAEAPTGLPDLLDLPGLPGPTRQAPEAVLAPEGFGQTAEGCSSRAPRPVEPPPAVPERATLRTQK